MISSGVFFGIPQRNLQMKRKPSPTVAFDIQSNPFSIHVHSSYNSSPENLSEGHKGTSKDILLVQSFQTTSSLYRKSVYHRRIYQVILQTKKKNNLLKKRCKVHDIKGFHLVSQVAVFIIIN